MLSSMLERFDGALERGMARVLEGVECPRANGRLVEDRNRFVVHALSLDETLFRRQDRYRTWEVVDIRGRYKERSASRCSR